MSRHSFTCPDDCFEYCARANWDDEGGRPINPQHLGGTMFESKKAVSRTITVPTDFHEDIGDLVAELVKKQIAAAPVKSTTVKRSGPDVDQALCDVDVELENARAKFPAFNSAHEGYAVLLEEVDELWDEVKAKQGARDVKKMRKEAVQVAAMALRFIIDVCDSDRGQK